MADGGETPRGELQRCIEKFHGVSLERILGEVEYLRDAGDSVIAGGSLAYGLGNQLSDLDLLITGPTTAESSRIPLQHFIGSLRVDVWKLGQASIEESFDRAEQALAADGALLGLFGDVDHEDEFKLLHRIASGVVVDGDRLEPEQGRDHRAVAIGLVVRECAERMRNSALLARLGLQAERPIVAAINARLAVEAALNATVTHRGLPFSGDKWLWERLDGEASDLAQIYEPFRRLPADPVEDAPVFVDAALSACVEAWGVDLAVETLMSAARWRMTDLQLVEVGTDQMLLSPNLGGLWALDAKEVEAWKWLASVGAEEPGATWGLGECDAEALLLSLRLYEHGLLFLDWTSGVKLEQLEAASLRARA